MSWNLSNRSKLKIMMQEPINSTPFLGLWIFGESCERADWQQQQQEQKHGKNNKSNRKSKEIEIWREIDVMASLGVWGEVILS